MSHPNFQMVMFVLAEKAGQAVWINPRHVVYVTPRGRETVIGTVAGGRFIVEDDMGDVVEQIEILLQRAGTGE